MRNEYGNGVICTRGTIYVLNGNVICATKHVKGNMCSNRWKAYEKCNDVENGYMRVCIRWWMKVCCVNILNEQW